MTHFLRILETLAFLAPVQSVAQGLFSPVITVDDKVISGYELDQRIKLLEMFRTPGDLNELAREQLVDDRLKQAELDRVGLQLSPEILKAEMESFAQRANVDYQTFLGMLAQTGVAEQTLRDFVKIGVGWREFVRGRYLSRVQVTEAEIDKALGQSAGSGVGIQVLLSEIIIPAPPERAEAAMAVAEDIAKLRSFDAFSDAARQVSALQSRADGGRLGWLPITNYPPQLRGLFLSMANGEVTTPIQIENGVALFQMRGVREVQQATPAFGAIDYAAYYIAGGRTEAGLAEAARVAARVDTCDDLYGVARNQPAEVLERAALPPAQIPQDVAIELARLDPGEVSTNLTRANGETLVFLMLCGRTPVLEGEVDREAIRNQLATQRLSGFANALVADLRAAATIVSR